MDKKKTDLRVIKTKKAIKDTFYEMISEMDYHEITIKELTARAMINRNTFYLHYDSIESLMEELQAEIADKFIRTQASYRSMEDIKNMIKVFFEQGASTSPVNEKLLCNGSYQFIYNEINEKIMQYRKKTNKDAFGLDEAAENIVYAFYGNVSAILFRQWVKDGKKLTLEQVTDLATKLICNGMSSVIKE